MRKTLTLPLAALLLAGCNSTPPDQPTACFEALETAEGIMMDLLETVEATQDRDYTKATAILQRSGESLDTYKVQKVACHELSGN